MESSWNRGRPVYYKLPGMNEGFQTDVQDDPSSWITYYYDKLLTDLRIKLLDEVSRQLDPLKCDEERLNHLARLAGYRGQYWDKTWPVKAKRLLIKHAFDIVWPYKGTFKCLEFVLNAFDLDFKIWREGEILIGITKLPAQFGQPELKYRIKVPLQYRRKSKEFKLIERLDYLFGPAFCDSKVVYENFYVGFSEVEDNLFEYSDLFDDNDDLIDEEGNNIIF